MARKPPRSKPAKRPAPTPAKATKPTPRPPTTSLVETKPKPTRDQIALAAYYRWLRTGGDPTSNWLAAEHELTTGRSTR